MYIYIYNKIINNQYSNRRKKISSKKTSSKQQISNTKHQIPNNPMKDSKGHRVPMTNQHHSLSITNNIATLQISQTYKNTRKESLEISWSFPVLPNSGITSLQISLSDRVLKGKLMEKQKADEKYEDAIAKGNTGYKLKYDKSAKLDILQMSIGNMKTQEEVIVYIGMVVSLEYDPGCWKVSIPAIYTKALVDISLGYKWEVDAVITSNAPILGVHSTHHIDEYTLTQDQSSISMKMSGNQSLKKDIEIRYRTGEVEKPMVEVVENRETGEVAAVVSFFPEVNSGCEDIGDKEFIGEKKEGGLGSIIPSKSIICKDISEIVKTSASSQAISLGEYIIVLDCSGSMSGNKISLAKSACQLFIRSLPVGCLFNIYLFGSSYQTLFGKASKEYMEATMQKALNYIERTGANMGGTDLAGPLRSIYSTKVVPNYPKSLFILTDGDVLNPDEVFNLVTKNVGTTRVHTLGISSSASKYLVKQCGLKGKGSYHFVTNIKNLGSEVIHTLGVAMRPSISGLKLHIPDGYKIKYSYPQVDQLLDIRAHEPFLFYAILERDINIGDNINIRDKINIGENINIWGDNINTGERPQFILSGVDTQTQTPYEYCIDIETSNPKSEDYLENIPKLAMKEIITYGKGPTKKEKLELSLKYGVLSKESAFFLEERCRGEGNIQKPMKIIKGNFVIAQEPVINKDGRQRPGTVSWLTSLNFHGGFGSRGMRTKLGVSKMCSQTIGGRGGGGVRGGRGILMKKKCKTATKTISRGMLKCRQEDVADISDSDSRSSSSRQRCDIELSLII